VNHERWLVSYADFVTLLFAFFVVLYAHSKTDQEQAHQIAASFRAAMDDQVVLSALKHLIGPEESLPPSAQVIRPARVAQAAGSQTSAALLASAARLNKALEKEIKDGRLEVRMERRGLIISLHESSIFASGDTVVLPETKGILRKVAENLRALGNPIRMEGHTDSVPIHNPRFRSNWELSAARSIALMEMFVNDFGVERERLSIAGFGEMVPVASNESAEGRARNRRVDIVVLTIEGAIGQPVATAQSARRSGTP
jgi:chemotaxis protein MotB